MLLSSTARYFFDVPSLLSLNSAFEGTLSRVGSCASRFVAAIRPSGRDGGQHDMETAPPRD